MIHFPHTSPDITTMMSPIRLPTPTFGTPLRPPVHLRHKHISRIKLFQSRRISISMPIDNLPRRSPRSLVFPAPKPTISRPDFPPAFLAFASKRSRAPQGHEPRVEKHNIQQPKIGYRHGEQEHEVDDQKRRRAASAAAAAIEEVVDCAVQVSTYSHV